MTDNAVAFMFKFPSPDDADECSNKINASLRSYLLPLLDCPPFAKTLSRHISSRDIQLLTAGTSSGEGNLYVFFDGPLRNMEELFKHVKTTSGSILSANCKSASFNGEVLVLARKVGIASGQTVMATPGSGSGKESSGSAKPKKWWQFWK